MVSVGYVEVPRAPAIPVIVRAGRDYYRPPTGGTSLVAADALTNPAVWLAAGYGYDNSQPAPVPVAQGMSLTWTTDPGVGALQGLWFNATAGQSYTLSVTVRATKGSARWRAAVGWTASTEWAEPDGYDQTRTVAWTAPESRTYLFGVETTGPNSSTHVVTAIGTWDQDDPGSVWQPVDLNPCNVALPVEIKHGRSGVDSQPDAPDCTFTYLGPRQPTALGDVIEVEVAGSSGATWTDPAVQWDDPGVSWLGTRGRSLRFRGRVTSVKAAEAGGNVVAWEIIATGEQARLGSTPVKITRPAETDVDRVQAIAAAAGVAIDIVGDPGPTLLEDNIDRDALGAIHEVCAWSGGLLWQQKDGTLTYGTMHRGEVMPEWRIACPFVADGIEWQRKTDAIVNHVTVTYGDPQAQDTYRDDPSIAKWGFHHRDVDSKCATAADASSLAAAILARRRTPRWVMPGVLLLRDKATSSDWAQVTNMDIGHTALIDVETVPTPVPGAITTWTVEGWVETWEANGRRVQLALSETRIGGPIPWSEADDETWDHWRTSASWLTAMVEV
jgi:hypothetical protein